MYPDLRFKSNPDSTKDQIINILTYDWPLSVKKIFFLLKKNYNRSFSYQAVYKAINQMTEEKIIEKTKEGYKLNIDWVKHIHNQTEIIRVNYFSEAKASFYENQEIRVLIFKSWFDVEKYLYYLQKNYVQKSKNNINICVHHAHEWRPMFYLRAEYNWITDMISKGHKFYTLCSGNSNIDKWSANFYKNLGVNIQINEKSSETSEILTFSDYVIQVYIPLDLKEALDNILKKSDFNSINQASLIKNIFEKETEIKVVINKDEKLASQIQKQTISRFI